MRSATKKIAPVWSLENFVAVNPYLGLTNKRFETAAHELALLGGIETTLPISFYVNKWIKDEINIEDLELALAKFNIAKSADEFILEL